MPGETGDEYWLSLWLSCKFKYGAGTMVKENSVLSFKMTQGYVADVVDAICSNDRCVGFVFVHVLNFVIKLFWQ